jgi:hypothetical protein
LENIVSITETELIAGIEAKNGFPLDTAQRQAIQYGAGPLLIAAGPGTGKTEVLVARCLKFMCCDGIAPGSIMLTTFTEKAAKNLQDRLSEAFLYLAAMYQQLAAIDPSDLLRLARVLGPFRRFNLAHPKLLILW